MERLRGRGATDVVGSLGPCIHPGCYEFAEGDLDSVADVYGGQVRGRTTEGRPALDVPAAIAVALEHAGGRMVTGVDSCTACGGAWFSHRARADTGRQALVVWTSGPEAGPAAGRDRARDPSTSAFEGFEGRLAGIRSRIEGPHPTLPG